MWACLQKQLKIPGYCLHHAQHSNYPEGKIINNWQIVVDMKSGSSKIVRTYNQMHFCSIYLIKIIMHCVKICSPHLILWRMQDIVEKYIYGIKVELWAWRVVIPFKLDNILVSLQNFMWHKTSTTKYATEKLQCNRQKNLTIECHLDHK